MRPAGSRVRREGDRLSAEQPLWQEATTRIAPASFDRAPRRPGELPPGITQVDAADVEGSVRRLLQPGPWQPDRRRLGPTSNQLGSDRLGHAGQALSEGWEVAEGSALGG